MLADRDRESEHSNTKGKSVPVEAGLQEHDISLEDEIEFGSPSIHSRSSDRLQ